MSNQSTIEWTDATWNPVTGCTQVSPGCDHCYALTFAERFRGVPGHPYEQGFDLRLWPERLDHPLRWKKPRRIFVNSMSDLFHKDVPDEFIHRVFDTMVRADRHTYQILTKRPQRLARLGQSLPWPPHIWIGVSVESNDYVWRADYLRRVPAAVRFISAEPLLGPVDQLESTGSIGSSPVGKAAPDIVGAIPLGSVTSEIAASRPALLTSTSSGADGHRRPVAGCSTAAPGTSYHTWANPKAKHSRFGKPPGLIAPNGSPQDNPGC